MIFNDTIAAISTPYGKGGIAVIRISGENALSFSEKFFFPANGKKLSEIKGNTTAYGKIFYGGRQIDDGIAAVFRAPHSYTGEDTVEISCHGGIVLSEAVLTSAIASGCRYAEAGEFTKRAFLNGKLTLSQAEAVMGLIDARTEEGLFLSSSHSRGVLSDKIDELMSRLKNIIASVYAYIDYPDEDLTDLSQDELFEMLFALKSDAEELLSTYRVGKAVCEGIATVIAGKPNAGKSSLLNKILGKERAIVTDIPGTTRDTVEETVSIGRVTLRLCDTAGIRETNDTVEKLGVDRSLSLIESSELVLAVFDNSVPLDDSDMELIEHLNTAKAEIIPIINKSDEKTRIDLSKTEKLGEPLFISAKNGQGISELLEKIESLYITERIDYDKTPVIVGARQKAALSNACEHLQLALDALSGGFTQDVAGLDLELALGFLGELDGRAASNEITDVIFSRFCVGK